MEKQINQKDWGNILKEAPYPINTSTPDAKSMFSNIKNLESNPVSAWQPPKHKEQSKTKERNGIDR